MSLNSLAVNCLPIKMKEQSVDVVIASEKLVMVMLLAEFFLRVNRALLHTFH